MQHIPLNLMGASASYVSNTKMPGTFNEDESGSIHLSGYALTFARISWIALSLIVTFLFIWSLVKRTFSDGDLLINILMPLGYFAISLIIFWRKSDDLMGLLTSLMLIFFGPYLISGVNNWVSAQPGWEIFGAVMVGIGATLVIFFLFLFPNGRFVPGWTRWFTIIACILIIISSFVKIWPNFSAIAILPVAAVGLLMQVYRYRRVSNLLQRQQTKWVLIGLTGPLLGIFVWLVLGQPEANSFPGIQLLGVFISSSIVFLLLTLLLPVTIAFSILRYRLWDIDILIRRTLVYAVLTGLLLLLYFGSVVLLQQVVRGLAGHDSPIVIVVSTLVIAALFSPLRRRVQNIIDHRFYRRKYDAQQALAAFAGTAKEEVDLESLQAELMTIVQETMQPEQVSLWMSPSRQPRNKGTLGEEGS